MAATRAVSPPCVDMLLAEGVEVNATNDEGSALHSAVSKAVSFAEHKPEKYQEALHCVSRLLQAGADAGLKAFSGMSALQTAVTCGDNGCLALLTALSAPELLRPAVLARLPETFAIVDTSGRRMSTPPPVFYAAAAGNHTGMLLLLHHGASRSIENRRGVFVHVRSFAAVRGGAAAAALISSIDSVGSSSFSAECAALEQSLIATVPAVTKPLPRPASIANPRVPGDSEKPSGQAAAVAASASSVAAASADNAVGPEPLLVRADVSASPKQDGKEADAADTEAVAPVGAWGALSGSAAFGWAGMSAAESTANAESMAEPEPSAPAAGAGPESVALSGAGGHSALRTDAEGFSGAPASGTASAALDSMKEQLAAQSTDQAASETRLARMLDSLRDQQKAQFRSLESLVSGSAEARAAAEAAAREARANLVSLGEGIDAGMRLLQDVRDSCRRELSALSEEALAEAKRMAEGVTQQVRAARVSGTEDVRLVAEDAIEDIRATSKAETQRLLSKAKALMEQLQATATAETVPGAASAARTAPAARDDVPTAGAPAGSSDATAAAIEAAVANAVEASAARITASVCSSIATGMGLAPSPADTGIRTPSALGRALKAHVAAAVAEGVKQQLAETDALTVASRGPPGQSVDVPVASTRGEAAAEARLHTSPVLQASASIAAGVTAVPGLATGAAAADSSEFESILTSLATVPSSNLVFRKCVQPLRVAADDLGGTSAFRGPSGRFREMSAATLLQRQAHTGVEIHLADLRMPRGEGGETSERVVVKSFGAQLKRQGRDGLRRVLSECATIMQAQGHPSVLAVHGILNAPGRPLALVAREAGAFFVAPRATMSIFIHLALGGPDFGLSDDLDPRGDDDGESDDDALAERGSRAIELVGTPHSRTPTFALQGPDRTAQAVQRVVACIVEPIALCPLQQLASTDILNTRRHGRVTAAQLAVRTPAHAWPYCAPIHAVRSLEELGRAVWRSSRDAIDVLLAVLAGLRALSTQADADGDEEVAKGASAGIRAAVAGGVSLGLLEEGLAAGTAPTADAMDAATSAVAWRMLPLQARLRLLAEAADGIAHLHSRHLVHRDVKPGNLFVLGPHGCIGDFGTAKIRPLSMLPGQSLRTGGTKDAGEGVAAASGDSARSAAELAAGNYGPPSLTRLASTAGVGSPVIGTDAYIPAEMWVRGSGAESASAAEMAGPASDAWSFGMSLFAVLDTEFLDPVERVAIREGLDGEPPAALIVHHGLRPSLKHLLEDRRLPAGVTSATLAPPEGAETAWSVTAAVLSACLAKLPEDRPSLAKCARELRRAAAMADSE